MRMSIIPGLIHDHGEHIDVLRGEETIACGWQPSVTVSHDAHHLLVLPGTHSKWLTRHGDQITGFTTFLTGELYDTLRRSGSLVGLLPAGAEPPVGGDAFDEGITIGLASRGLLHDIFALRAAVVAGARTAEGLSARLSGLLIGAEIAEARRHGLVPDDGSVQLVADGPNGDRYAAALSRAGLTVGRSGVDACLVRGWIAVAPTGSTEWSR
jgi:2-dehydro-3-deoxygalactonokinase